MSLKQLLGIEGMEISDSEIIAAMKQAKREGQNKVAIGNVTITIPELTNEGVSGDFGEKPSKN
ncbi:MAG: hypothetical protein V3V78_02485 [Candidatus Woesearchaeota archaeon]